MRTLLLAAGLLAFIGCTDDGMFSSCPFDNSITTVCEQTDGDGAQLSCVVEAHPQCPEDVCLSWRGSSPFCTRTCTLDGGECPDDSTCSAYSQVQNKFYCVENANLQ
jgi:hypothetical protein